MSQKVITKYKLVFIGDQAVGKTSIINRFVNDTFQAAHQSTIGIDFLSKTIQLENKTVRLQLWDTAGQERFRSLIPSYIRDSNIAIVVYDVTNSNSFQSISKWLEYVRDERGNEAVIVLVGNKMDAADHAVKREEAENFAKENDLMFFLVSAKEGTNIQEMLKSVTLRLMKSNDSQMDTVVRSSEEHTQINLAQTKDTQKKECQC